MSGEPGKRKDGKRLLGRFIRIGLYAIILIFFMGFSGNTWPLEIAFHLIVGPIIHGWRNLPPFIAQWRSSLLPLACLVVAIMLAHRFICWWIINKEIRKTWRWGHTAAAGLLVLLGSAAAIAMSGITHQAAWLFSSPWLEDNRRTSQTVAVNNARQMLIALFEYETAHGRYPDTLDKAVRAMDQAPQMLWVETGPGRLREPFIFLRPGRPTSNVIEPVLVSPVIRPDDKVAVGYSDCSVRSMPLKAWQKLAKKIQAADE